MFAVLRSQAIAKTNFCFLATGRSCLMHLIERYIPDRVYMPWLVPEGVLAPFEAKKIPIRFYKLKENFDPDVSDLAFMMDVAGEVGRPLIIVIAYFGYPVETREAAALAHEHHGLLLEDSAHSLQGHERSCADLQLFSLNKILPCPDGAMLVSKTSLVDLNFVGAPPPHLDQSAIDAYMMHLADNHILAMSEKPDHAFALALKHSNANYERYYKAISSNMEPRMPTTMSRAAYQEIDFKKVTEERKRNANIIKGALKKEQLYREDTPVFALPVRTENRENARDYLVRNGIFPSVIGEHWHPPSVACATYPFEVDFLNQHLLLPCGEGMTEQEALRVGLHARMLAK